MKIPAYLIVSGCVLVGLASWRGLRFGSQQHAGVSVNEITASSVPVAAVAPQPARQPAHDAQPQPSQPSQPKPERPRATPDTGLATALANSESPVNSQDLNQNREWARTFPAEALVWLAKAAEGDQRIAIAEIALPQLAQTNAAASVALARNYFGDSTNTALQFLLGGLVQQWAGQDFATARTWALSQPAGEQRDALVQRIAMVESQTKPGDAARMIAEQMSPGPTQDEAAISVLYQWAQQDATAALAWAQAFPPGTLRERAINEVLNVTAYASGNAVNK
ncbi:MAG TPA: hypothetical protein VF988_11780 [Verrucomicrobiae bacterium]